MSLLRSILPFSNAMANMLSSSGMPVFAGIYAATPIGNAQIGIKLLIDLLTLSGVLFNTVHTTMEHGRVAGVIKGLLVVSLAFILPNMFMQPAMLKMCGLRCTSPWQKIAVGTGIIVLLTLVEKILDNYLVKSLGTNEQMNRMLK